MSRATAEQLENWMPGGCIGKWANLRRYYKRVLRRIRRREEKAFARAAQHGLDAPEPRPRHLGGWVY